MPDCGSLGRKQAHARTDDVNLLEVLEGFNGEMVQRRSECHIRLDEESAQICRRVWVLRCELDGFRVEMEVGEDDAAVRLEEQAGEGEVGACDYVTVSEEYMLMKRFQEAYHCLRL